MGSLTLLKKCCFSIILQNFLRSILANLDDFNRFSAFLSILQWFYYLGDGLDSLWIHVRDAQYLGMDSRYLEMDSGYL